MTLRVTTGDPANLVNLANAFTGQLDCSLNPNYPAASAGDTYRITVAGKIGGALGFDVLVNDVLACRVTGAAGTHADVGANWDVVRIVGADAFGAAGAAQAAAAVDATNKANNAQANAIATASADTDTDVAEAISTAAADATTKANNAQSGAISTAAADATSKANAAQTAAEGYSDAHFVPLTRRVNGHALSADIDITKSDVGLGNCDDTSDASKPVSTAQQSAINAAIATAAADATTKANDAQGLAETYADATCVPKTRKINTHALSADVTITKEDVGLSECDNTADHDKPISNDTQTALNGKQPLITPSAHIDHFSVVDFNDVEDLSARTTINAILSALETAGIVGR